eukprot:gene5306-10616_t
MSSGESNFPAANIPTVTGNGHINEAEHVNKNLHGNESDLHYYRRMASTASSKFVLPRQHGARAVKACSETLIEFAEEIKTECSPNFLRSIDYHKIGNTLLGMVYVPYLPPFHRPGWLTAYVMGPYTGDLLESFISDIWAGIIVALTLLPQGLSYAQLANVPPINGLYCAVLPSAVYTFLGTSMQLGVGPVAIVSLLVGQLIAKYEPNFLVNTTVAIDIAAQIALVCGIYLFSFGMIKAGNLINFISHPVMSGFTSAAAMLIGLSQLKNAFGFPSTAPQTGQHGYEYNYQVMTWFIQNWYATDTKTNMTYINPYATKLTFVGASIAKHIITTANGDPYALSLKVVGNLPSGIDILRIPNYRLDWGTLFGDVLPLTLISFMESYSVARRIATQRNELHILNTNQELFAIGLANMMCAVSSAFPVSGSFSRSSLNAAAGAKTPLSKATTMSVICISLAALTTNFYYIPNAALAAIIWVAISSLISPPDFWEAWKHSKKDFFVLSITFILTLVLNTELGLCIGILSSILAWAYDSYWAHTTIDSFIPESERHSVLEQSDSLLLLKGVEFIRVNTDITFVSIHRIKDYIIDEVLEQKEEVINTIMIDFTGVTAIDLTGLIEFKEIVELVHAKGVLFGAINLLPSVQASLLKFHVPIDTYESICNVIPKIQPQVTVYAHDMEEKQVKKRRTSSKL